MCASSEGIFKPVASREHLAEHWQIKGFSKVTGQPMGASAVLGGGAAGQKGLLFFLNGEKVHMHI